MNKNQKGNIALIIILVIAIAAIVGGLYLIKQRTSFQPQASAPSETYNNTANTNQPAPRTAAEAPINSEEDLDRTLSELDNTNPNQLDQALEQNDSDAAAF